MFELEAGVTPALPAAVTPGAAFWLVTGMYLADELLLLEEKVLPPVE